MQVLNGKLDDFINYVKNTDSNFPHTTSVTQSRQSPSKRSPSANRMSRQKSPARTSLVDLQVESRLQKVEATITSLTFRRELQQVNDDFNEPRQKQADLQNLAGEIDTALKNLETRLLTTLRSNIDAQKFDYLQRIEDSNRQFEDKLNDL